MWHDDRRSTIRPQRAHVASIETENPMSAYLIGHVNVRDAEHWAQYRSSVPRTLTRWGGELVFRGRLAQMLSGQQPYAETVVLRFPDLASIDGWHRSDEYQALIPIRQLAADVLLSSYQSDD